MPRKRNFEEMDGSEPPQEKQPPSLLRQIRNMWEFASTMQYIFLFGKAVKIDEDFDVEDFETECLKPGRSEKLEEIGLTLLKWISSHRGLNLDIWDEYARRQYISKAPHLNPYGDDEEPTKFRDFDIFQKIRILHQLTVWTLWNPDRLRERMPEHQRESDQLEWRVEELGYDREDRLYYVLDDNRLYRRTDPPLPSVPKQKPKANTKKALAARRRARRRVIEDSETPELEDEASEAEKEDTKPSINEKPDTADIDTFGGHKWECIAITLSEYHAFCDSIQKSRDPNEKILRQRIMDEVISTIEAAEEKQRRKVERRERDLLVLERLAGAKRSSRIQDKIDREKREQEVLEAEKKHAADLAAAHREKEKQEQMELDRQYRMMTREQRIKDREYKRLLVEEELTRDEEEHRRIAEGQARGSERQLKERMEKNKKDLEILTAAEDWTFDCAGCGVHGKNLDDGSHSVACERCNVWQHSKCLGISTDAAEQEDFQFVCQDCKKKEEEAKRPKISLKFKVGSASSPTPQPNTVSSVSPPEKAKAGHIKNHEETSRRPPSQGSATNGYHMGQPTFYGYSNAVPPSNMPVQANGNHSFIHYHPPPSPNHVGYAIPQHHHNSPNSINQYRPPNNVQQPAQITNINPTPTQNSSGPSNPRYPVSASGMQSTSHNLFPYSYPVQGSNPVPTQYQHNSFTPQQIPSAQQLPRPTSSQHQTNGLSPVKQPSPSQSPSEQPRTSPILNRPIISPTQGNQDVGPIAGIPQSSPTPNQQHVSSSPILNGTFGNHFHSRGNVTHFQQTPLPPQASRQFQSGYLPLNTTPRVSLSGLSPTKHVTPLSQPSASTSSTSSPPLPPPSNIPMKMSISSPSSSSQPHATTQSTRSVSGTPILPPIETFAPSAEQLRKLPMPTPSKQPTPAEIGRDELRRVSNEIERSINEGQ